MRTKILLSLCCLWFISPAFAVDHNNIDAGRPLDFDDAEAIAYGEKSVEVGASLVQPGRGSTGAIGSVELLYGVAKNSHVGVDFDPRYATGNGVRRGDFGDVGVNFLHNFNREYGTVPALSLRADAYLPTGRDSRGVDFRLRGIASRHFRQYDRLHLNLDLNVNNSAAANERSVMPGVILGYSHPLGYPTRFDQTLVAQIGYRANETKNAAGITSIGIGLRRQISVDSVFDVGLVSELTGGANREKIRLTAGYSKAF